jgi:hypothetical protein
MSMKEEKEENDSGVDGTWYFDRTYDYRDI